MNMLDAAAIKSIRTSLEMTQTEFAAAVGVTQYAVISWENGTRHPSWKRMEAINHLAKSASKATNGSRKVTA